MANLDAIESVFEAREKANPRLADPTVETVEAQSTDHAPNVVPPQVVDHLFGGITAEMLAKTDTKEMPVITPEQIEGGL